MAYRAFAHTALCRWQLLAYGSPQSVVNCTMDMD